MTDLNYNLHIIYFTCGTKNCIHFHTRLPGRCHELPYGKCHKDILGEHLDSEDWKPWADQTDISEKKKKNIRLGGVLKLKHKKMIKKIPIETKLKLKKKDYLKGDNNQLRNISLLLPFQLFKQIGAQLFTVRKNLLKKYLITIMTSAW